jgi:hypothetical protein
VARDLTRARSIQLRGVAPTNDAAEPPPDVAADLEREAIRAEPVMPPAPLRYLTVEELIAPPKPRVDLVGDLDWSPGRVALLAAEGYSGKSLAALSACVSVASGKPIWGWFRPSRVGPAAFVDYEIGEELSRQRARRLAIGMGLDFANEVAPSLRLAAMPRLYLTSADGEAQWCRALDGCAFAVVDSLRRASPGVDENDSRITEYLDRLTRVSLATGCSVLVIHHASTKTDGQGRRKAAPRGSSAIFDAAGSVLIMTAEKGEPALVSHEKAPTRGTTAEDFYLRISDVEIGDDPKAGLAVAYQTVEQVEPPKKVGAVRRGEGQGARRGSRGRVDPQRQQDRRHRRRDEVGRAGGGQGPGRAGPDRARRRCLPCPLTPTCGWFRTGSNRFPNWFDGSGGL